MTEKNELIVNLLYHSNRLSTILDSHIQNGFVKVDYLDASKIINAVQIAVDELISKATSFDDEE